MPEEASTLDNASPLPEAPLAPEHHHPDDPPAVPAPPAHADEAAAADTPAPPDAPAEVAPEVPPPPSNKHWYVVKVQSGREETIKESIERRVKIENLEEYYGQIYIPAERVTEMRRGKRYTREKKTLPGYIMAEVEYNDRILYLFRETPGVGDFVGATVNKPPPPMTKVEVARWMGKKPDKEKEEPIPIKPEFEKGDHVKVKDGIWKDMEGEVKDLLEAKSMVRVELTIFGRPVPVELEYWHVERI